MNFREFNYGIFGGTIGTFISHPFDTIKTRKQLNPNQSLINTIKNIGRFSNFYKGIIPPIIGVSQEKAIVFGTFYNLNKYNLSTPISGFLAGISASLIVTPIESLKIHLQNGNKLKDYKIKSCYRGLPITFFRESPGYAIYFSTYQNIKKYTPDKPYFHLINGCLAGGISWSFIYPADFIKTMIQNGQNYNQVIKSISKNGIGFLYRGFSLALMRAVPLHGGVFMGYEFIKNLNE